MEKFQHKLRTTLHTRSVENIMTRTHAFFQRSKEHKQSQNLKIDNITTYLRKFEIDRENLNLAKRIMQCESEHSRNKYARQWKKTKKFLRVRSNFKPQLSAEQPKIYKFESIPGHGRLFVNIEFSEIGSVMKLLSSNTFYLLKFSLGSTHLIPNKQFLTLDISKGYTCTFFAPFFLKNRPMTVKLIKVIENSMFQAGKFAINLAENGQQRSQIVCKSSKICGHAIFKVNVEILEKRNESGEGNLSNISANKQNDLI